MPYARRRTTGALTPIADAERGQRCDCVCLGCNRPVIAKQGGINAWHFAHATSADAASCEGWLHATAKALLHQRITGALQHNASLKIKLVLCDSGHARDSDLLDSGKIDKVALEQWWAERKIQPDLTLSGGGKPLALIEVVVSHPPEPPVIDCGVPVLEFHPRPETVAAIPDSDELEFARVHNYPCSVCSKIEKEKAEKEERRRNRIEQTTSKLRNLLAQQPERPAPNRITDDRYGNPLRYQTLTNVNNYARLLAKLGLTQQPSRSTLFKINPGKWTVYVDLDSTETIRIWEVRGTPAIYVFPCDAKSYENREVLLESLGQILTENNIPWRRHFEDAPGNVDGYLYGAEDC